MDFAFRLGIEIKKIDIKLRKKRKKNQVILAENEGAILDAGILMVKKLSNIFALRCEGEWFPYLFSVLRSMCYKIEEVNLFYFFWCQF